MILQKLLSWATVSLIFIIEIKILSVQLFKLLMSIVNFSKIHCFSKYKLIHLLHYIFYIKIEEMSRLFARQYVNNFQMSMGAKISDDSDTQWSSVDR